MKNFKRVISVLLIAAMMTTVLVTAVSAEKALFKTIGQPSVTASSTTKTAPASTAKTETKTAEKDPVKNLNVFNTKYGSLRYVPASSEADTSDPSTVYVANPNAGKKLSPFSFCGKYYAGKTAAAGLSSYFSANCMTVKMKVGDKRAFGAAPYMVSDNPTVAAYDGEYSIEAKAVGTAYVYVFTTGGVPFYCLKVVVSADEPVADKLILTASNVNPKTGETSVITAKSAKGNTYTDIEFSIIAGKNRATITADGTLTASKNGVVAVRAASKSHPEVYGDAILYIGRLYGAIADGYWTAEDGKINVTSWCGNYDLFSNIKGWVLNEDGLYIPVLGSVEGDIVSYRGTEKGTVIFGGVYSIQSLIELYKTLSGDNATISTMVGRYAYELSKTLPASQLTEKVPFDNRTILLARMIEMFGLTK